MATARRRIVACVLTAGVLAGTIGTAAQNTRVPQDRDYITGTPQGVAILAAEDGRAATPVQLVTLVEAARAAAPELRLAAVRALGRLERRDVVTDLLTAARDANAGVRAEAAYAIGQAMQGPALPADPGSQQVDATQSALLTLLRREDVAPVAAALAATLARLPYERADQVQRAEEWVVELLTLSDRLPASLVVDRQVTRMVGAARALEILARTRRNLFAPNERTTEALRRLATGTATFGLPEARPPARTPAFRAVVSARLLDAETLRPNLTYHRDPTLRQLAMLSLAGAGSPIVGDDRLQLLREGLDDPEYVVRYEALRGYARHGAKAHGCLPLTQMLRDPSEHVVLAALDALGDACAADDVVVPALIAEARAPKDQGDWRRESHALVALAKRLPDQLEVPLIAHSRHNRWQVRMYAARAAAIINDEQTLERLALDDDDNVREVTLAPLKRRRGQGAEPSFLAALQRNDYQLLRTAARELAGLQPTMPLTNGLLDALARVTAQRRETSRDTRIALLERLREFGGESHMERLRPLLQDFDPRVAAAAAATMTAWSGQPQTIEPKPLPREPLPQPSELKLLGENVAVLVMERGRELVIQFDPVLAPMASVRFLRLANRNYFDGLTFHRVVTNFVLQGGSPGANEYMGDGPYLRDEIGAVTHARGTVGLSTRGRDTGDAQFFINLLDNPRLDFDYTIVGRLHPSSLEVMDQIHEGDRITDVHFEPATRRR